MEGVLEPEPGGGGYLRCPDCHYERRNSDPYVSAALIRQYGLRPGVWIEGIGAHRGHRLSLLVETIQRVQGLPPEQYASIKPFYQRVAVDPHQRLRLECGPEPLTLRVLDLLVPLGKGQRGLIVAPPRSGKTVLLQHLAMGIASNHPDVTLLLLLVDERPEELTEFRRLVGGEVIGSTLDARATQHVRLAELIFERAKRLAEVGQDVVLLVDSITRLARAYNKEANGRGRTMTGGLEVGALDAPKGLFGSARVFEEGGSLTVIATALIETGSRMDEIIFQEFKGTGNLEIVLDRRLAERRLWPAMDISRSGTRKEEKLLDPETLRSVIAVRRRLAGLPPVEAMESLLNALRRHASNKAFVDAVLSAQSAAWKGPSGSRGTLGE